MILSLYDIILPMSIKPAHSHRACGFLLPLLAVSVSLTAGEPANPGTSPAEIAFVPTTSRSVAVNRSPETPEYVGTLTSDIDWLDFGVQSRTRYESRWNDYQTTDLITDDVDSGAIDPTDPEAMDMGTMTDYVLECVPTDRLAEIGQSGTFG